MPNIPVVENPRRRRKLSRKQIAAGFGGKRRKSTRRKRRNPGLAVLGNPRRRRYYAKPMRRRGRRRNPSMSMGGINLTVAAWTAGGMVGTKVVPMLIQKFWPGMPTAGPLGYVAKVASAVAIGFAVKKVSSAQNAQHAVNGAVALLMYEAFTEFVAPNIGLNGLGGFVSTDELLGVTGDLSGFVSTPTGLGRYGDISQDVLAA